MNRNDKIKLLTGIARGTVKELPNTGHTVTIIKGRFCYCPECNGKRFDPNTLEEFPPLPPPDRHTTIITGKPFKNEVCILKSLKPQA